MARAPIDGDTLQWARELGRVTRNDLARAVGVRPERVSEFESGLSHPTFRQLTLIASKLDRPLGFFFAPAPADPDVPETADFRGRAHDELPPSLAREMRRAEQHREAMLDLVSDRSEPLNLSALNWGNLGNKATDLRRQLGLLDSFVPTESQTNQVFNFWRGLVEAHGVLVFQTTKIPLETFRGLSVHHQELPVILINGADSASGKSFTLFHEIAHLANRTSGLCALRESVSDEALANRFAANFLMPESAVRQNLPRDDDPFEMASRLASMFRVSTLAAAVRLRTLGAIDDEDLDEVRERSDADWRRVREAQKNSDGFAPPWRLRYRDLGPFYIGVVAQALEDRRVDMMDATYLLNARLPMVEQLLGEYYRTGGTE
jgi:Zn-dependent peptidase ImmA (M78 family)/transcriptional regulator with XRE-family HTH domain